VSDCIHFPDVKNKRIVEIFPQAVYFMIGEKSSEKLEGAQWEILNIRQRYQKK
jgi:hypothetical protein